MPSDYLIIKLCPVCRQEFTQSSRNPDGRKYCSAICRRKGSALTRRRRAGRFAIEVFGLSIPTDTAPGREDATK